CSAVGTDGTGGDPDGDGLTNLQEFMAGSSPIDSASAFRIVSIARENDDVRITWTTVGGRTNFLQAASRPSGSYVDISPAIAITGTGATTTNYFDIGRTTNAAACFYRVRLGPPPSAPTISCPADVMVNADPGLCVATNVALGSPVTADNCAVASVVNDAPASYPVGTNAVVWTATDIHGNARSCTQEVIVVDSELPSISCPVGVTVSTDAGQCTA